MPASWTPAFNFYLATSSGDRLFQRIDLEALVNVSKRFAALVGHELPSKYLKAALGEANQQRLLA